MKLGLKVNVDRDSYERLRLANPSLAEVWFNASAADTYTNLFAELTRRKCDVGLHFWGLCDNNIAPNISYPDQSVIRQSMALMRQTIDTAAKYGFSYVNIHPGASALAKVDYTAERYDLISEPVDTDRSIKLFLQHAQELSEYAKSRNVIFTVETVPARITDGWYNAAARGTPKSLHELPVSAIQQAADLGLWVANDFCHTAANVITDTPDDIWTFLQTTTQSLAPQTRLIHLGFIMPPYNGTDNHDMLDNPILDTDAAVPNNSQMIELLKLFRDRDDIWILTEPKEDHVKNYFLAEKLLNQAL